MSKECGNSEPGETKCLCGCDELDPCGRADCAHCYKACCNDGELEEFLCDLDESLNYEGRVQ